MFLWILCSICLSKFNFSHIIFEIIYIEYGFVHNFNKSCIRIEQNYCIKLVNKTGKFNINLIRYFGIVLFFVLLLIKKCNCSNNYFNKI